eukprot:Nk52_evm92s217 gene=Nk52_evmTU92s217
MSSKNVVAALGAMYFMNRINLNASTEEGAQNQIYVAQAYGFVVFAQVLAIGGIYYLMSLKQNDTKITVPKQAAIGEETPKKGETETITIGEYDMRELVDFGRQVLITCVFTCGLCWYMKVVTPMFIQLFTQGVQLYDNGLVQAYIFRNTEVQRPFKKNNPIEQMFSGEEEEAKPEAVEAETSEAKSAEEKKTE